ncbi:diphthine--ammonia ligase isoform X2 [Acanthochromis polyacanthus]|uniref:diphthine--ammonia ligase isoform X2 n=1 Tax=Acanthochromis polyacanthus TaxID=80966 RepID=UPI002234CACE|nr:diphthine--ammonia ligase isoform X2 [Acanthochromis polyacanthus]
MKVVALISGGKDSCYNMMQCVAAGHRIVALANLRPAHTDELDSYMYQTVGHQAIELYADAMELPLYRRTIQGSSLDTSRDYSETEGDEVEDLYQLLHLVKEKEGVEAVSVGAILSDYQRVRVENVCLRLGLQPLAYLWRRDQESLLSEMISSDLRAILIKVAAFGLDPEKHLGKPLADMEPYLKQLSQKYGVHICGEGGEYETFTLDCPLFKKKIVIDAAETVIHSADAFAPVGYLRFTKMHTENKDSDVVARALPHGSCPCQSAIDKMTEEVEYADQAEDNQHKFTSNCDLSCQQGHDFSPSCSSRSSRGYQWISGINGLKSKDTGIQGQTSEAFIQLQRELDSRAWKMKNIILVHLYVRNMEDFVPLNDVYKKHFGTNPPARVCVQAPLPAGQLLQMDCLLHDWTEPLEEGCFHQREALHVQSLSHWAPANIGPYSQALRVDEVVFCAGQIALVPCTMQLVKAGTYTQACLCCSHVKKVLEAVISSLTLAHIVQVHCYTTQHRYIQMIRAIWESMLRATEEEKELLWESEMTRLAPLLVVVVPALPKGADVELHVTAVQDDPTERAFCHTTTKVECGSIECHTLLSSDHRSASLSLSLAAPDGNLEVTDVKSVTEEVGATFKRAVKKMDAELVPQCARVFYKCSHSLAQQIVKGLEESFQSALAESSPSAALVPVLDLPDSQILHLSCWLSL